MRSCSTCLFLCLARFTWNSSSFLLQKQQNFLPYTSWRIFQCTTFPLPVYQLMSTKVVSIFWLLWIILWYGNAMCLFSLLFGWKYLLFHLLMRLTCLIFFLLLDESRFIKNTRFSSLTSKKNTIWNLISCLICILFIRLPFSFWSFDIFMTYIFITFS